MLRDEVTLGCEDKGARDCREAGGQIEDVTPPPEFAILYMLGNSKGLGNNTPPP